MKSLFLTPFDIDEWLFYLTLIIFFFLKKNLFFSFPIITDIVFTLFYDLTREYDLWYSDCFLSFLAFCKNMFSKSKKACPNYVTKLTYNFVINILCSSLFFLGSQVHWCLRPWWLKYFVKNVYVQIKKERFVSIEYTFLKYSKSLFLDLELWCRSCVAIVWFKSCSD